MTSTTTVRVDFSRILQEEEYDWVLRRLDNRDEIGPLTIHYGNSLYTVRLEKTIIGGGPLSTGDDLFQEMNRCRNWLAEKAWELWNTRLKRFVFSRRLTWRELLNHAGEHNRAALIFALALLRANSEGYGPVRAVFVYSPTPGKVKDSVNLPQIKFPGVTERVWAIQAERA